MRITIKFWDEGECVTYILQSYSSDMNELSEMPSPM